MKTALHLPVAAAVMVLACSLPAWGADAPKAASSQASAAASAPVEKAKKRTVAPHNHMRDGKGLWVPEKKARKQADGADAGKASAATQTSK